VADPISTYARLPEEDIFDRHRRLSAELARPECDAGRAAAIREELDAMAPRIAAKLRTADAFRAAWGMGHG
jgi:hypothetical protein